MSDEINDIPRPANQIDNLDKRLIVVEEKIDSVFASYQSSDAAYKKELGAYSSERSQHARARTLAMIARVTALILLAYIAYRVS